MISGKELHRMGYEHAIGDRREDRNLVVPPECGQWYTDGYNQGLRDAKEKRWYVASMNEGEVQQWYRDGNWTTLQEEATVFETGRQAREKSNQLMNEDVDAFKSGHNDKSSQLIATVGYGIYIPIWK